MTMTKVKYNVISADSHIYETPDLWEKYMEPAFKHRAPKLVKAPDGTERIVGEGFSGSPGMGASAGKKAEDVKLDGSYATARQGAFNPAERVKDMAMDGVDAEILYPTIGMTIFRAKDQDYMMACLRAYNTWLAEFTKIAPEKLIGVGVTDLGNVQAAVEEVHRTKKLGLRGILVPAASLIKDGFGNPVYEPFWKAVEETDLPLSMHTFAAPVNSVDVNNWMVSYSICTVQIQTSIAQLIFSGVFERHPKLRLVSVENDVTWAPNLMERMDHVYNRHRFWAGVGIKSGKLPSQFFKDHIAMTFVRDSAVAALRHHIGVKNILWSSDYPHADTSWPNSKKSIQEHFGAVAADERYLMVAGNAAEIYRLN